MSQHFLGCLLLAGPGALLACNAESSTGSDGAGGACMTNPHATFDVAIKAETGPVPPDTSVTIRWGGMQTAMFKLDDPASWKTTNADGNLLCDVPSDKPPPMDLTMLTCEVWTGAITHLTVEAAGFTNYDEDLSLSTSDRCAQPFTKDVKVVMSRPDGGS